MSVKALMWLCTIFKEASKDREKVIRRWNNKEKFTEIFCTRKVNEYGRYLSIISFNGLERSVLIVPELAPNTGWNEIAFKIERFVQCSHQLKTAEQTRNSKSDLSYARATTESKWHLNTLGESSITCNEGDLHITDSPGARDTGLFKRCIVGSFKERESELPSLSNIRRWSAVSWKAVFGVSIYEMASNMFLFEFPNRNIAEQIIQRKWSWGKTRINFQW